MSLLLKSWLVLTWRHAHKYRLGRWRQQALLQRPSILHTRRRSIPEDRRLHTRRRENLNVTQPAGIRLFSVSSGFESLQDMNIYMRCVIVLNSPRVGSRSAGPRAV